MRAVADGFCSIGDGLAGLAAVTGQMPEHELGDAIKVEGLEANVKWLPDQDILLLGDPMVFTKDNIEQFNF